MKKLIIILFLLIYTAAGAQTSASSYIKKHKDDAVELMNLHGVPASIILAVAMHESANGTSKIARYLNNHFGMKGKNSSTKIKSAYRGYKSVELSYLDFVSFLERRSQFDKLFIKYPQYDYKSWALGIQRGGYAASRTWASQVIATVKKYELWKFDNIPAKDNSASDSESATVSTPVYKVKRGDTLGKIAWRSNTTVKAIMQKNHLKGSNLEIGQELKL